MTEPDTQVDDLLHALTHPDVRTGLEARIVRGLETRQLARAGQPSSARLLWVLLAAATLAVVMVTVFTRRSAYTSPLTADIQSPPTAVQPVPSASSPIHSLQRKSHLARTRSTSDISPESDIDPAFLPSVTPPPMPLTADERHLQRFARRLTAVDVARMELPTTIRSVFGEMASATSDSTLTTTVADTPPADALTSSDAPIPPQP